MAEFLIRAQDSVSGVELKGDIIEPRANGAPYGNAEGLPNFVVVKVPSIPLVTAYTYFKRWTRELDFSIISFDPKTDTYTINICAIKPGNKGIANLTKSAIQEFLANWNCVIISSFANNVVVGFNIFDLVKSFGFWQRDLGNVVFTELGYDNITGIHQIKLDYSAMSYTPTAIEVYLLNLGCDVVDHVNKIIIFELDRNEVLVQYKAIIKKEFKNSQHFLVKKRRYFISKTVVDNIIAQGGVVEVTPAQFLSYLNDKAA